MKGGQGKQDWVEGEVKLNFRPDRVWTKLEKRVGLSSTVPCLESKWLGLHNSSSAQLGHQMRATQESGLGRGTVSS